MARLTAEDRRGLRSAQPMTIRHASPSPKKRSRVLGMEMGGLVPSEPITKYGLRRMPTRK